MVSGKSSLATRQIFSFLLTASLFLGLIIGSGGRANHAYGAAAGGKPPKKIAKLDKLSPDLRQKLKKLKNLQSTVTVVLQLKNPESAQLKSLLKSAGVRVKGQFARLDSKTVELPAGLVKKLEALGELESVSLEREVNMLGHVEVTTGAADMRRQSGNSNFSGKDVNIAVLDSGIYKDHHSFGGRVALQLDFTGENRTDDPYGHGTHVAALAAASDHVENGGYTGPAFEAKIINLRVLDSHGRGTVTSVLRAMNWLLEPADPKKPLDEKNYQKYKIKVVNMSLGAPAVDSYQSDPLCKAARRLVDAGLVVVVAAGNNGKDSDGVKRYGAIHAPGNEPSVITVGASNTYGTDQRGDDGVATYSSRGPTRSYWTDVAGVRHYDNIIKPEIVAPGNKLVAARAKLNELVTTNTDLALELGE